MSRINRGFFFAHVRSELFAGKMTAKQVEGFNTILDFWENEYRGAKDDRHLAYALATAYHETAYTMQPVREYGSNEYKRRLYDVTGDNPARARKNGNTEPGDGVKYAGAGYVQLTWKNNYALAGKKLRVDLVNHPELALVPRTAAMIMFQGMAEGWFTGKCFNHYLLGEKTDFRNARRIINGLDRADHIAQYAMKFYSAICYTT